MPENEKIKLPGWDPPEQPDMSDVSGEQPPIDIFPETSVQAEILIDNEPEVLSELNEHLELNPEIMSKVEVEGQDLIALKSKKRKWLLIAGAGIAGAFALAIGAKNYPRPQKITKKIKLGHLSNHLLFFK